MPEKLVALTHEGSLTLCKTEIDWERDLCVELLDPVTGQARQAEFPSDELQLTISGLSPERTYQLSISRKGLVRKLTSSPALIDIRPSAHELRAVVTGSGRCGTQSVARYLDGMTFNDGTPVVAQHETLSEHLLPRIVKRDLAGVREILTGFQHQIEAAPYLSIMPESIQSRRVIHLIRDGRRVVQSGVNRGWYQNESTWNQIKPRLDDDVFTASCHLWTLTNQNAEAIATRSLRLEDLAGSPQACRGLLALLDIDPSDKPFPQANKGKAASGFGKWDDGQKEVFTEVCGEMMDAYYPDWQNEW